MYQSRKCTQSVLFWHILSVLFSYSESFGPDLMGSDLVGQHGSSAKQTESTDFIETCFSNIAKLFCIFSYYKNTKYNQNLLLLIRASAFWFPRGPLSCKSGTEKAVRLEDICVSFMYTVCFRHSLIGFANEYFVELHTEPHLYFHVKCLLFLYDFK
jgi:hypothetical protein